MRVQSNFFQQFTHLGHVPSYWRLGIPSNGSGGNARMMVVHMSKFMGKNCEMWTMEEYVNCGKIAEKTTAILGSGKT